MIDQALVLFGMPNTLFAKLSIQRTGGKAPDAYHLILGYETMQVVLKSSYLVRDQGPRYKLLGSQGTLHQVRTRPPGRPAQAGSVARQFPHRAGTGRRLGHARH